MRKVKENDLVMTYLELVNIIKKVFKGLEDVNSDDMEKNNYNNSFKNILIKMFDPPAYIVKILMIYMLKLKYFRSSGKVSWYTYFKFRNYYFRIRDYKFGTWTLEGLVEPSEFITGTNKNSEIYKTALILKKRIQKASKFYDKIFMSNILVNIRNNKIENYYLNSSYNKLLAIYEFFKHDLDESIANYENFLEENKDHPVKLDRMKEEDIEIEVLGTKQNLKTWKMSIAIEGFTYHEKVISNYALALMSIFFSLLEFILDSFYLFCNRTEPYLDFKKQNWYEKYKIVFPIITNKTHKRFYDKLGQIKKKYRNPLIHGLTKDSNLLIPIPDSGLVPISYEYLTDNVAFRFYEISYEESKEIRELFNTFLDFLKKEEPYKYYILYFKFEFPIPINKTEIEEIKSKMTSYEDFEQELLDRVRYEEMIRNRDF